MVKPVERFRTENNRTVMPFTALSPELQQLRTEVFAYEEMRLGEAYMHRMADAVNSKAKNCGNCILRAILSEEALEVRCFPPEFAQEEAAEAQEAKCARAHEGVKVAFQQVLTEPRY